MEFNMSKLPRTILGSHDLPEAPGIYFAIDAAKRVWYIGKATNLRQRHSQHERLNDFKLNRVQYIAYFAWEDADDINMWEQECMEKFKPPLNDLEGSEELPTINLGYDKSKWLDRYKECRLLIDALTAELEELKPNIVTLLEENDGRIKNENYSAYLNKRNSYSYPENIIELENQLKKLKKQSETDGTATLKSVTVFPIVK